MKALLYLQRLSDLGKYRIYKDQDYDEAKEDGEDLTFYEYIKVKDSQPEKGFPIPSHVSKYSSTELSLYLKDHRRSWKKISKLLDQPVYMDAEEAEFRFPYEKFWEIDKILHFVRKRERKSPMNENEKQKARLNIEKVNQKRRHISGKSEAKINGKRLDDYLCAEVKK